MFSNRGRKDTLQWLHQQVKTRADRMCEMWGQAILSEVRTFLAPTFERENGSMTYDEHDHL
ncbi:MAG: hypothetical protein QGG39_14155 [Candidatus Poribacteria bacterium]|nr:hypothetical protein [Candidatus Poribacteria bacterium]